MPDIDLDARDYRPAGPLPKHARRLWGGILGILASLFVMQFSAGWSEFLMAISCLFVGANYRRVAGDAPIFGPGAWSALGGLVFLIVLMFLERAFVH
jgi:uncharacterized membrane protein YccC